MAGSMDWAIRELERMGCRPIVVASHPRSGSHLCIDTLRLNFPACASRKRWLEPADRLYLDMDGFARRHPQSDPRLLVRILGGAQRPIIKTHALPDCTGFFHDDRTETMMEFMAWLRERATWIYAYRDGRDALCSLQHFLRPPASEPPVSIAEFIRQRTRGMSRVKQWASHVQAWIDDARVYCISMEELLRRTSEVLPGVAEKLGTPLKRGGALLPERASANWFCRVRRRVIRQPQSTAIDSLAGSGRPVAWREAFTAADRRFVEDESEALLIKLGYEESSDWTALESDSQPRFPAHLADPARSLETAQRPTTNRAHLASSAVAMAR